VLAYQAVISGRDGCSEKDLSKARGLSTSRRVMDERTMLLCSPSMLSVLNERIRSQLAKNEKLYSHRDVSTARLEDRPLMA